MDTDDATWAAYRREMMLDPDIINLNTGSFGPLPRPVFDRATDVRRMAAAEPTHFFVRQAPPLLWEARERLAGYLGTQPTRLVFATNVSTAINLVASVLSISGPGEVLLTDHEYGAMHWCWERAARRQGLTLRTFPLPTMTNDPAESVASATRAMSAPTWLFFFGPVLTDWLVLPARGIVFAARDRGILTVVDGAHAGDDPLDLSAVGADFYTGNCHKWMLAPAGGLSGGRPGTRTGYNRST